MGVITALRVSAKTVADVSDWLASATAPFKLTRYRSPDISIDDLVFPQGASAALKLHSDSALSAAAPGHAVQWSKGLEARTDAGSDHLVQSGAVGCMVGGAGLEPAASSV